MISDKEVVEIRRAHGARPPRRGHSKGGRPVSIDGFDETAATITMRWLTEVVDLSARAAAVIVAPYYMQRCSKTKKLVPIPSETLRRYYIEFRKRQQNVGDTEIWTQDQFRPWRDRVRADLLAKHGNAEDRATLNRLPNGDWGRVRSVSACATVSIGAGLILPPKSG